MVPDSRIVPGKARGIIYASMVIYHDVETTSDAKRVCKVDYPLTASANLVIAVVQPKIRVSNILPAVI